jgi:hypothetical protein
MKKQRFTQDMNKNPIKPYMENLTTTMHGFKHVDFVLHLRKKQQQQTQSNKNLILVPFLHRRIL